MLRQSDNKLTAFYCRLSRDDELQVNFKTYKQSYKSKKTCYNPEEKWLVFENTHEAIIDADTWERVQELRKTKGYREQQINISYDLVGILPVAMLNDLQSGKTA